MSDQPARWSQATIYPDMWADPADDPRNSEGVSSTMSLLGLLRHPAEAERAWRNWISDGDPLATIYVARDADFDGAVAEQAEVDAAYSALARDPEATDAALALHPDPGPRCPKAVGSSAVQFHAWRFVAETGPCRMNAGSAGNFALPIPLELGIR